LVIAEFSKQADLRIETYPTLPGRFSPNPARGAGKKTAALVAFAPCTGTLCLQGLLKKTALEALHLLYPGSDAGKWLFR
jgi:hypothetical protein